MKNVLFTSVLALLISSASFAQTGAKTATNANVTPATSTTTPTATPTPIAEKTVKTFTKEEIAKFTEECKKSIDPSLKKDAKKKALKECINNKKLGK